MQLGEFSETECSEELHRDLTSPTGAAGGFETILLPDDAG